MVIHERKNVDLPGKNILFPMTLSIPYSTRMFDSSLPFSQSGSIQFKLLKLKVNTIRFEKRLPKFGPRYGRADP